MASVVKQKGKDASLFAPLMWTDADGKAQLVPGVFGIAFGLATPLGRTATTGK